MEKWIRLAMAGFIYKFAVSKVFITRGEVIHTIHGDNLPSYLSTFCRQEICRHVHRVIHDDSVHIFWIRSTNSFRMALSFISASFSLLILSQA